MFSRKKSSDREVHAGEGELYRLRNLLVAQKEAYEDGDFSGHPEEMLEAIEVTEYEIREVEKAKRAGWVVDEVSVANAIERLEWWKQNSAYSPGSDRYQMGVAYREYRIELAEAGIIHL